MAAIREEEAELVLIAMQLEEQVGERVLPMHEMGIIAFYHPEDETRRIIGNAMVSRIMSSQEPDGKKAATLAALSKEEKFHAEARVGAGQALCEIIKKSGNWEKAYAIAMDPGYPKETRNIAALGFLCNSCEKAGIAAVLGCSGISENIREANGFRIVHEALENGDRALVEMIAAERGLPKMLALYIKAIAGSGAEKGRFGKERKSEPPNPSSLGRLPGKL